MAQTSRTSRRHLSWGSHRPSSDTPARVHSSAPKVRVGRRDAALQSCSAPVVSHHLDGLLRSQVPGLLHPGSGQGSPDFRHGCAPECLATSRQRHSHPVRIRAFPPTLLPLEDHSPVTASSVSPRPCSLLQSLPPALRALREFDSTRTPQAALCFRALLRHWGRPAHAARENNADSSSPMGFDSPPRPRHTPLEQAALSRATRRAAHP